MLAYQQRVVDERMELDKKVLSLDSFIETGATFAVLESEEQVRLKEQLGIMRQYSEILGKRIQAFEL